LIFEQPIEASKQACFSPFWKKVTNSSSTMSQTIHMML
jgi:hypothetical protein